MRLNLNDIIGRPGVRKPFAFDLDLAGISFPQVEKLDTPFAASGYVENKAGALELTGELVTSLTYRCDRCMKHVPVRKTYPVTAHLAEKLIDEENPDIFLLENGAVDLDEVFTTAFVLAMESKFVCNADCAGLCITCGADLNDGACACKKEVDPRLAALQQLLDKDE